jgi:membrane protein implicated in regulation of membrane protease activity
MTRYLTRDLAAIAAAIAAPLATAVTLLPWRASWQNTTVALLLVVVVVAVAAIGNRQTSHRSRSCIRQSHPPIP